MSEPYETPERKTDIAREVWLLTDTLPEGSYARDVLCDVAEWLDDGCCYDLANGDRRLVMAEPEQARAPATQCLEPGCVVSRICQRPDKCVTQPEQGSRARVR